MTYKNLWILAISVLLFTGCSSDDGPGGSEPTPTPTPTPEPGGGGETVVKPDFSPIHVTTHEGKSFEVGAKPPSGNSVAGPGGSVMMQAYYWDVPMGGTWWDNIRSKVDAWSDAGIGAMWLPPVSKGQSGGYSMGYDPYDYFDFGQFHQHSTTETRFGSKDELVSLISAAHDNDVMVYADIVLNHNSGGGSEYNPVTKSNTWTDYTQVASGLFKRNYEDFYPSTAYGNNDEGSFGDMPDLIHKRPYVQDWFWKTPESVGQYYKNVMKFDGWRFDYVKGFGPWVVKEWNAHVGGFSVGELWDTNLQLVDDWVKASGSNVLDFSTYYKMDEAFDGGDLTKLLDDMYWKRNPHKSVTFVANHDTDEIWNKRLAYAYILTHEGYPVLFYRDYEEWLDKNELNTLIKIHNEKATGTTSILYADRDEYIARRNGYNGNPGLIVYFNTSPTYQEKWVETSSSWSGKTLVDLSGNETAHKPTVRTDRWVKIKSAPNSYTVWSVN